MKPKKTADNPLNAGPKPKNGVRAAQVRVLATRYPELSHSAIARRVGCTPQSVSDVLKHFLGGHSEDDLRAFQTGKVNAYDSLQLRCLESVTSAKLDKSSAGTLVTAAAILQDKAQILKGLPTGMDVHVLMNVLSVVRGDKV
jgi:hypothetical protein